MDNVIIEIRNNVTGDYTRVPVTPETIQYTDGDKLVNTVKILGLGNVNFKDGVDLDGISWSRFFPAKYDPFYCTTSDIKEPIMYRNIFSSWKDEDTSLQVVCAAAGINANMKLTSFNWELKGAEGDIYYTVSFVQHKEIKPQQIAVTTGSDGTIIIARYQKGAANRPAVAAKTNPKTYKVQQGDTLTAIAKKFAIASWKTLYNKNRNVIGADPDKIIVGQVLTL